MLSKILDDTMSKTMKMENITRASRFATARKKINNENLDDSELLMLQKISKYVKPDFNSSVEEENSDIIVERPEQKETIINFKHQKTTGLPFFRSIEMKLNEIK